MTPGNDDKPDDFHDHEDELADELSEDVYELREEPESQPQPGQGSNAPQPLPPLHYGDPAIPQPQQLPVAQIDSDLICIQCGYNLRGLMSDNTCPECGTPVQRSIRTDQLVQADAGWLASLKIGTTLMLVGIAAGFAFAVISGCAMGAFSGTSPGGPPGPPPAFIFIQVAGNLLIGGLFAYAIYRVTQPEPGRAQPKQSCTLARWTLLPAYLIGFISSTVMLVPNEVAAGVGGVMSLLNMILFTAGFIALMLYLRSLALRVPNPDLARGTSIVLWGLTVTLGSAILLGLIAGMIAVSAVAGPGGAGPVAAFGFLGCMLCPLGIAMFVFGIWWIVLISQYRAAFSFAHMAASQYPQAPPALPVKHPQHDPGAEPNKSSEDDDHKNRNRRSGESGGMKDY